MNRLSEFFISFVALGSFALSSAVAEMPTRAELDIMIGKWKEAVKPGLILRTKSANPILFRSVKAFDDYSEAMKIGDKEILIKLQKEGNAIVGQQSVKVRLLRTTSWRCIYLHKLGLSCQSTESQLATLYQEIETWNTPKGRKQMTAFNRRETEASIEAGMARRAEEYRNHDISKFVAAELAIVRVIEGPHIGEEVVIKLDELTADLADDKGQVKL